MPSRFPDGTRVLTVPAVPPKPALVMTLFVDGDSAWSVQGAWAWNPLTHSYYCAATNSTVQNDGNGQFSGAAGSTSYSGGWT